MHPFWGARGSKKVCASTAGVLMVTAGACKVQKGGANSGKSLHSFIFPWEKWSVCLVSCSKGQVWTDGLGGQRM